MSIVRPVHGPIATATGGLPADADLDHTGRLRDPHTARDGERDALVDGLVVLGGLLGAYVLWLDGVEGLSDRVDLAAGLLATAATTVRRRWPVEVMAGVAVLACVSYTATSLLPVVLGSLLVHRSWPTVWPAAALAPVPLIVLMAVGRPWDATVVQPSDVVGMAGFLVVGGAAGVVVRRRRRRDAEALVRNGSTWDPVSSRVRPDRRRGRPEDALAEADLDSRGEARRWGLVRRSGRDVLVDVLVGVATILVVLPTEDASSEGWETLALLGCCLALVLRRRRPIDVAVGTAAVGAVLGMALSLSALAVFFAVVHRPLRVARYAIGAHAVAAVVFAARWPQPADPSADLTSTNIALLLAAQLIAAVGLGSTVRARRVLVASWRLRAEQAEQQQARRVAEAQESERVRIAREMHDVLAHRISLLSMHAGALEFRPDAPPADIARAAGIVRESAHLALVELRQVVGMLRSSPEDEQGRPAPSLSDVRTLVREHQDAGQPIEWAFDDVIDAAVPTTTGLAAYRILQEALTNTRKHAPGAAVDVTIDRDRGGLRLIVVNRLATGSGLPGAEAGLIGLRERASLAGGTLEHDVSDGVFRLQAWLPLPMVIS